MKETNRTVTHWVNEDAIKEKNPYQTNLNYSISSVIWQNVKSLYCFYLSMKFGVGAEGQVVLEVSGSERWLPEECSYFLYIPSWQCLVFTSIIFVFESIASCPCFTHLHGMWSAFPLSFWRWNFFEPTYKIKGLCKWATATTWGGGTSTTRDPFHPLQKPPDLVPPLLSCKSL